MESDKIKTDTCVSCGKETGVPINRHIDARTTYIEGAGQICSNCFIKYFKKVNNQNNDVSDKL